jgi:hypothetical protein
MGSRLFSTLLCLPAAAAAVTACYLYLLAVLSKSHLCAVDGLRAVLKVCAKAVEGAVSSDLGVLWDTRHTRDNSSGA